MMLYLGLETQTLKDGLVHGETSLLEQGATQGPPILVPTLARHLPAATLARHLPAATLARHHPAATLARHLPVATLARHLPAATLARRLLAPTLAPQHLLILAQQHQEPNPGNRVGLGPTRLLDNQALREPTLRLVPLASLLDH
uniref:Galectin 3 n=2 Tax=Canis lupus familiaris TaxID=9615 RepID=A0A8I3NQU0_CANLF